MFSTIHKSCVYNPPSHGVRDESGHFKKNFIGFHEMPRSTQKINFVNSNPHGVQVGGGVNLEQILVLIEENVQICTEKSSLPSPRLIGWDAQFTKYFC